MANLALNGGTPIRTAGFTPWPVFDDDEVRAAEKVIRSGKWWRYVGNEVSDFEREFASYHGARFAVAVTSGTTALELALAAMGIGPGDEVIVPSYTFVATATAAAILGATPVFADVELDTCNIDAAEIARLVSARTKAIVPVHFGGYPVDFDGIGKIAAEHGLSVLEDAAHAHGGAMGDGRMLGSIGDAGAFSFQASKNMTCGDGGIVITSDEELAARMFSRHTFGRYPDRPWYEHHIMSTNARMTEIHAAILRVQLGRLMEQTAERYRNARSLDRFIAGTGILEPMRHDEAVGSRRAYHLHMSRYSPGIEGVDRSTFIAAAAAEGIPFSDGYQYPLYRQPLFERFRRPEGQDCENGELRHPNAERACREILWLPQNLLLGDGVEDVRRCVEKLAANADELRKG